MAMTVAFGVFVALIALFLLWRRAERRWARRDAVARSRTSKLRLMFTRSER